MIRPPVVVTDSPAVPKAPRAFFGFGAPSTHWAQKIGEHCTVTVAITGRRLLPAGVVLWYEVWIEPVDCLPGTVTWTMSRVVIGIVPAPLLGFPLIEAENPIGGSVIMQLSTHERYMEFVPGGGGAPGLFKMVVLARAADLVTWVEVAQFAYLRVE